MLEAIKDPRSILSAPSIYGLFNVLIGASRCRRIFVNKYVRPQAGNLILDIGCGPADIIEHLPKVKYIGFDASPEYIQSARSRFGDRADFRCELVSKKTLEQEACFDIVLATGILHHLDDLEALQLCQLAHTALKPGGRLVTFDGCYMNRQSPITRYLLSKDRGQYVRDREGYLKIVSRVFSDVAVNIRHDLLRIPYTHIILECTK